MQISLKKQKNKTQTTPFVAIFLSKLHLESSAAIAILDEHMMVTFQHAIIKYLFKIHITVLSAKKDYVQFFAI